MVKNQNDLRTMSLRSKNLNICRLSGNKCTICQPRTATGRFRTSNKVPFAPSHRPLQDSMVKNQNDQRTMNLRSKNIKFVDCLVINALFLSLERLRVVLERQIRYRSLRLIVLYKIRWSKIRIDPQTMSLRSINLKIVRLSGN